MRRRGPDAEPVGTFSLAGVETPSSSRSRKLAVGRLTKTSRPMLPRPTVARCTLTQPKIRSKTPRWPARAESSISYRRHFALTRLPQTPSHPTQQTLSSTTTHPLTPHHTHPPTTHTLPRPRSRPHPHTHADLGVKFTDLGAKFTELGTKFTYPSLRPRILDEQCRLLSSLRALRLSLKI